MTPMIFDLIIVALILLSVAIGFMRGFCNEVFTIFGWIAAVIATIYFTPVVFPIAHSFIEKEWLAKIAASAGIFLATLGICSALSYFATKTLHASKLGMVDRTMGFGFGILRAVVLLGLGYLLYAYVFSNAANRPEFVQKARSRPLLEASAEWIQMILPLDTALGLDEKILEEQKASGTDNAEPEESKALPQTIPSEPITEQLRKADEPVQK